MVDSAQSRVKVVKKKSMTAPLIGGVLQILLALLLALVGAQDHSNNWAVLVCTSRFWFNYRVCPQHSSLHGPHDRTLTCDTSSTCPQHVANTLGMYRSVKRLGIPDSNIILMLADDMACNPRNMFPGTVYSNSDRRLDLYGERIEVDYRGDEVSVENFIRLLTGRVLEGTPRSKRLMTDERSNVLVYMTGHGGEEFLKFQDSEEISAFDLADAFQTMWAKRRYNEIMFMIDTCQANTMLDKFYSPNIFATGSSAKGENSYSHHADSDIGVAVVDRFSHFVLSYLEGLNKTSSATVQDFVNAYSYDICHSTPGVRTDLLKRPLSEILMTDFFGGVTTVELSAAVPPLVNPSSLVEGSSSKAHWEPVESEWETEPLSSHHAPEDGPISPTEEVTHSKDQRGTDALILLAILCAHLWAAYSR